MLPSDHRRLLRRLDISCAYLPLLPKLFPPESCARHPWQFLWVHLSWPVFFMGQRHGIWPEEVVKGVEVRDVGGQDLVLNSPAEAGTRWPTLIGLPCSSSSAGWLWGGDKHSTSKSYRGYSKLWRSTVQDQWWPLVGWPFYSGWSFPPLGGCFLQWMQFLSSSVFPHPVTLPLASNQCMKRWMARRWGT